MQPLERAESSATSHLIYDKMLNDLTEEDVKNEIDFIGSEPITIKTTNAQEMYNFYQMYWPNVMVFDMRASKNFNT